MIDIITDLDKVRVKSKRVLKDEVIPIATTVMENFNHDRAYAVTANQLGIMKRLALIKTNKEISINLDDYFILYNPKVIEEKYPIVSTEECLSIPTKTFQVNRFSYVKFINGDGKEYEFTGLYARILQHEIDHFDGVLICDKELKPIPKVEKIGRNEPCPCGSGKKYKKCCEGKTK